MTHFKLIAMAFITLAVGCSQSADRGSELLALGNGPELPEECNICWEQFTNCFEEGLGSDHCEEQIIGCIDSCNAPPPPPTCDHCAAGYQACVEVAEGSEEDGAVADCAHGFEGCLYACEREDLPQDDTPPGSDDCDACMGDYNECVNAAWEEVNEGDEPNTTDEDVLLQCEDLRQACDHICEAPPPPTSDCSDLYEQCHEMDMSDDECQAYVDENCDANQQPPTPTPDCSDLYEQCDEMGMSDEECQAYVDENCDANQPQPDPGPSADECADDVWTQCEELGLEGQECEEYVASHCP